MWYKKSRVLLVLTLIALVVGSVYLISVQVDKAQVLQQEKEEAARIEQEKKVLEQQEADRIAEEKRIEEEAKRKQEEEAKKIEAELNARNEKIKANTYYVKASGAALYATSEPSSDVTSYLKAKKSVYVDEKVTSSNGDSYLKIKENIDATEVLGYLKADDVVDSLAVFIAKPIADVDYSYYPKHTSFESNPKIDVKAIYVTGPSASNERLDELITLIDETNLNAMVIDVKDDNGFLLFHSPTAEKLNPEANEHVYIKDMKTFMDKMKEHNVYLIARIVSFKSPIYAKNHPERAIVYKDSGKLYSDADRLIWASAYDRELWAYNVGIAKEAAAYGFNEIQFDYVRFPAIAKQDAMDYRDTTGESHTAVIQEFLKFAYEALTEDQVYISADVFGWAASALDDVGIGQHWEAIANVVDYISPMVYPSHYGPGNFGLPVPDAYPFETVDRSVKDAIARNANLTSAGNIRPWIQHFTATWVNGHIKYGIKEVKAQIAALEANGINEYLVWNAGNYYYENAFK